MTFPAYAPITSHPDQHRTLHDGTPVIRDQDPTNGHGHVHQPIRAHSVALRRRANINGMPSR